MSRRRGAGPGHRAERRTRHRHGGDAREERVDLAARLGIDPAATGSPERRSRAGGLEGERLHRTLRSHRRRSRVSVGLAVLLLVLALAVLVLALVTGGLVGGS